MFSRQLSTHFPGYKFTKNIFLPKSVEVTFPAIPVSLFFFPSSVLCAHLAWPCVFVVVHSIYMKILRHEPHVGIGLQLHQRLSNLSCLSLSKDALSAGLLMSNTAQE